MTRDTAFKARDLVNYFGKIDFISVTPIVLKESFPDMAARFSNEPGTVVLLSGGDLDCARYHILAIQPWLEIKSHGRSISLTSDRKTVWLDSDPFEVLRHVIDQYTVPFEEKKLPVAAGLFGYLSYDLKDFIEELPRTALDDTGLPQLCLFAPSVIIIHDKLEKENRLCVVHRVDRNGKAKGKNAEDTAMLLTGFSGEKSDFAGGRYGLKSSFSQSAYVDAVQQIKEYIVAGDIYQVNMSQRFETDFSGNPFSMFRALYDTAPNPFYAYVNAGDHWIVSTSPERFLKRVSDMVETRPIKGTRPRGKTDAEDRKFREALVNSRKDDAELSMIVDLMRNDLGRVCKGGSVRVSEHRRLEAYHNVFHLVSVIEGELAAETDSVDLLKAAFPGGSITGCPRIRAMEIIDELEPVRRHVYTGSIGYISFHDTMDLSIAIRTATIFRNRMIFSVGGGVVFDSDPGDEFEETLHKGRSLMCVLEPQPYKKTENKQAGLWQNGKIVSEDDAVIPVTDLGVQYGLGFFETIRVDHSRILFLEDHIRRFYRAWDALFERTVPDLSWEVIIRQVLKKNRLEKGPAAVKIMATFGVPNPSAIQPNLIVSARKYSPRPAIIRKNGLDLTTYPHPRQTPLADHKTLNYAYYYLAGKWAIQKGADEALILNPDGSVSETNTANILLISGNRVISPKSAHVLSGVMESHVLKYLAANGYQSKSRKMMPEDLFAADQVILTNSLLGAVPVLGINQKKINSDAKFCQAINKAILNR